MGVNDLVNHPPHYKSVSPIGKPVLEIFIQDESIFELECIEAIELLAVQELNSYVFLNAIKYLWRCGQKGSLVEDLEKALWCLRRLQKTFPSVFLPDSFQEKLECAIATIEIMLRNLERIDLGCACD